MDKLKISIVTPSYNQGQFIEQTIRSVLNQGYKNLEYIIIDGGSSDNTVEIIKKYENHLAYWVSEKDNGQTHAINKGFELATGDIIAWLNSDDLYCEGSLDTVAHYFENNSECHWMSGNILFMNGDGDVYIRKHPNSSPLLEKLAIFSIYQPSTFFRKSILTSIGYPKENFHMMMDYEWFCRIALKYHVHTLNCDLSMFRYHEESKSSSAPNTSNQLRYHSEALSIIEQFNPSLSWFTKKIPKMTLFVWFRFEKLMRIYERLRKNELGRLGDKAV